MGSYIRFSPLPISLYSLILYSDGEKSKGVIMRVYIVENSKFLRERLTKLVAQRKDVNVVGHAATAQDAIRGILRVKPDVVLLDLRLDEGTGFDVLHHIKGVADAPLVIVLTNYAYPQYRERFLAAGADYFFDKSTELELMLQALDTLRYRLQGEKQQKPRQMYSVYSQPLHR